jgi:uncharacterized membrane protein YuzA (DUF378 family)
MVCGMKVLSAFECIMYSHNKCAGACGKMKKLAGLLVLVGGINWGLVGIFDWDLISAILGGGGVPGGGGIIATIIYILVGLSAVWLIFGMKCGCKGGKCSMGAKTCNSDNCKGGTCKDGVCTDDASTEGGACGMCGTSPCSCGDLDDEVSSDEDSEEMDMHEEEEDEEAKPDHMNM